MKNTEISGDRYHISGVANNKQIANLSTHKLRWLQSER